MWKEILDFFRKKPQPEPDIANITSEDLREIIDQGNSERAEQAKLELAKRARGYTFYEGKMKLKRSAQ